MELTERANLANQTDTGPQEISWPDLVRRIRGGDATAMEELYRVFSKGIRFFLYRQLGPQDLDDKVHDVWVSVTQSIQQGALREPERLMGYVRTVVRRQVAAHIDAAMRTRRNMIELDRGLPLSSHDPDPERRAIDRQNEEAALRLLRSISPRDREVLVRFYLQEQPAAEICRSMNLSETQFRLIKSRAKARFGELGRRRFAWRKGNSGRSAAANS